MKKKKTRRDIKRAFIIALFTMCLIPTKSVDASILFKNEFLIEDNGIDTFIIDAGDDITGNINLQFGATLAESLFWDSTENRFTFSDDLRIEGNQGTVGQTYIANDHTATSSNGIINLGRSGGVWEIINFNASTGQFELSDDVNIEGYLGVGTATTNFNLHLYDTTSTTVHEWQVFDNGTDQVSILTGTENPSITAINADIGSIFYNTSTGDFYTKKDDGSTTNWDKSGLSADLLDALQGTYETPSATNKFVTDSDPRLTASSGDFGEVSLGTHLDYPTTNVSINNIYIYYTRIFLPADTTVSSFGIHTTQTGTGYVNFGLYSDNGGVPYTKLTEVGSTYSTAPANGWWSFPLGIAYDITTAGIYWIAFCSTAQPRAHIYAGAEDSFIPFRIETKSAGSSALPATANPVATGSNYDLPFLAAFE